MAQTKIIRYIGFFILFQVVVQNFVKAQHPEFPYKPTDYNEAYRGQFHFSPQNGWMNDVNGIWYYGGIYHLSFQHYPHGLMNNTMHWGHATSPDLLSWTQQPIMLEPGVNVPGDCFSGSAIVDTGNTSGLQKGHNPVFVAIYTATSKGTCLAYSNDLGATWQPYSSTNPNATNASEATRVNIGGPNADSRDPHVFWYEPTKRWVCLLYEKVDPKIESGTSIYTSLNLKDWTKTQSINWGYECPDMYVLELDDNPNNKKWILQNAKGEYLIGQFDGNKFTQEGNPYPRMACGAGFYGAQTFFRNTFPDNRVVQLSWMAWWNKLNFTASVWTHCVTFPVELKLKSTSAGMRVVRYPISEIKKLHAASQYWTNKILHASENLLDGITSKTFDMEIVIDLTATKASKITFKFADNVFVYYPQMYSLQSLSGLDFERDMAPINGKVKFRFLVDRSQFEVFGNDGEYSFSDQFGTNPSDSTISVTSNGDLKLVSAQFHNMKRTWPAIPDTIVPTVPTNLIVSELNSNSVKITFTPSIDNKKVIGYQIIRNNIPIDTCIAPYFCGLNLTEETNYSYSIKAFDAVGNMSDPSESLNITTIETIANSAISHNKNIILYTNPANDILNFKYESTTSGDLQMELFNSIGKIMLKKYLKVNEGSIHINNFSEGTYIIRFQNGNTIDTMKFIKY